MDINALKKMSYEEVRHLYMPFLQSQGVGPNTQKSKRHKVPEKQKTFSFFSP